MEYKILEKMFEGETPESVFEIGVGGGGLLKDISDSYGGLRVGGVDISKVRMANLKNIFPNQEFLVHDLNDPWPVPDNSYDIVFSVGVLMYIFDPIPVVKEMFRVSKHKVIITEFHHGELDQFGVLTKPFRDKTQTYHGIIRNYIDVIRGAGYLGDITIFQSNEGKSILKCLK